MNDDTSAIPSSGCSVITSTSTISNYNQNTRKDYIFNGGKWYLDRTQTANFGNYDITGYNCIDVTDLNSYSVYTPFFYAIAFALFVIVLCFVFKTIKGFIYGF